MISKISHSLEETKKIAADWVALVSSTSLDSNNRTDLNIDSSLVSKVTPNFVGINKSATIIGLSGNLGSGKTTFTQCVAQELGITEFVTSPTFVIMKIYPTQHAIFKKLIHIDAYRFEKSEELEVLELDKLATDPQNLIIIEWPEKVAHALPVGAKTITFEVVGESERRIDFI